MKTTKWTNHIRLRKIPGKSWGLKNTLEYLSFFSLFIFGGGARGTLCHIMKEEESEQRVTAEGREKPLGYQSLFMFLNTKSD